VPPDVRQWLEQTARYNGGTLSGEAVRALRERMEHEGKHRPSNKANIVAAE
jgi:hypothetical protein